MKNYFLDLALNEAKKAYAVDEIPVGCVIVSNNEVIACGYNQKEKMNNCLMHAEIIAINEACNKLNSWRLDNCVMYVTLKPCMMCMGAIVESRIKAVYYGTEHKGVQMYDINDFCGKISFYNVNDVRCSKILSDFFENKRKK